MRNYPTVTVAGPLSGPTFTVAQAEETSPVRRLVSRPANQVVVRAELQPTRLLGLDRTVLHKERPVRDWEKRMAPKHRKNRKSR